MWISCNGKGCRHLFVYSFVEAKLLSPSVLVLLQQRRQQQQSCFHVFLSYCSIEGRRVLFWSYCNKKNDNNFVDVTFCSGLVVTKNFFSFLLVLLQQKRQWQWAILFFYGSVVAKKNTKTISFCHLFQWLCCKKMVTCVFVVVLLGKRWRQ